jgi:hypothetical protein
MRVMPSEKQEKCLQILVEKPKGKRVYGRRSRRWEDDERMYLQGTGYSYVDCTRLTEYIRYAV